MARDLVLDVVTHSQSAGLREAARELDATANRADRMGQRFHEAGRENGVLSKTLADARNELKRMEEQLAKTGDTTLLKGITSQRSLVSRLDKVVKDLRPAAQQAGVEVTDSFGKGMSDGFSNMGTAPVVIGALVGVAVAAAPMIGAIIGGAVTGAVGLGGIAGGIAAAASDPAVKGAWQILTADASIEFKKMGAAFVEPTTQAIGILDAALIDMHLDQVFAPAAGFVTTLAHGVGDMATQFSAGFGNALANAGPVMQELATDLGDFGRSFGQMLSDMSQGQGNAEGLRTAFALLDGTMIILGKTVETLSNAYHNFIGNGSELTHFMAAATRESPLVSAAFGQLANVFDGVAAAGRHLDVTVQNLDGSTFQMATTGFTAGQMAVISTDYYKQQAVTLKVLAQAAKDVTAMEDQQIQKNREYVSTILGIKNANLAWHKDLLDIRSQLQANGKALDDHSQKGIANSQFFLKAAADAERYREELISQGVPLDEANAKFNTMIKTLENQMIAAGLSKKAVHELLDQLLKLPNDIPVKITFKTSGYGSALDELASFSGAALSGGVVVTARPTTPHGFAPARAEGGPVWPGQAFRINERGGETVTFPAMGQVHPANLSPVGGGPIRIHLTLDGTGLAQNLKAAVRGEGGVDVFFEQRR